MTILVHDAVAATFIDGKFEIDFKKSLTFPVKGNPRLECATLDALNNIELSPFGVHWPELDEDLSFEGILRGEYGQR